MNEIVLSVTGMTCGGCVNSVHKVLTALPGVQSVEVTLHPQGVGRGCTADQSATTTLTPGQARVVYDPAQVDRVAMVQAVVNAGFGAGA
jgi:copper chaperone